MTHFIRNSPLTDLLTPKAKEAIAVSYLKNTFFKVKQCPLQKWKNQIRFPNLRNFPLYGTIIIYITDSYFLCPKIYSALNLEEFIWVDSKQYTPTSEIST